MRSFGSVAPPPNMDDAFRPSQGQPISVGCGPAAGSARSGGVRLQGSRRLMVSEAWPTHD